MSSERSDSDSHAILIDWDLSRDRDDTTQPAPERTGTWQFAAARLLRYVKKGEQNPIPGLADDLESFVHVLTWLALRRTALETDPDLVGLGYAMLDIFDECYVESTGELRGGSGKATSLMTRRILRSLSKSPLSTLLYYLFALVAVRYEKDPMSQAECYELAELQVLAKYYKVRMDRFKSSDHMIQLFNNSLNGSDWPSSNAAAHNIIPEPRSSYRRQNSILFCS